MEQPIARADILGKLLLIQQVVDVLPDRGGIAAFLRRALGEIPGVIDVHLCVRGEVFPRSDDFSAACAKCEASWNASGNDTECMVGNASTIRAPLRTARRLHGMLILSLGDEGAFSPYRDFVQNIANVVAMTVETREYLQQLADTQAGLEDQIAERTASLRASEERFRGLFENTPVPIWEEDFSEVWAHLERLPRGEIGDIDAHLRAHPEIVRRCAELVRVIDVNEAAVRLYQAASKDDLLAGLTRVFSAESFEAFRRVLVAMWTGSTRLLADAVVRTLAGEPRSVTISWAVAPGSEKSFERVVVAVIDVTERQVAEAALREREERFRLVFENASDAMYLLEVLEDGRFRNLEVNPALSASTGLTREQMIGHTQEETVPAAVAQEVDAQFRSCAETGLVVEEYKQLDLPAGRRSYHTTLIPVRNGAGRVDRIVGISRDVTERESTQRELVRLGQVVERAADGVAIADATNRVVLANPSICAMLGYDHDEIVGLEIAETYLDEDRPQASERLGRLRAASGTERYERLMRRKDGSMFPVEELLSALPDGEMQAIIRDITERKREEEALRAASAYTRALIEADLDPLVTISPDGVITDVNVATMRMTGVPRDRLIGTDFADYFTEPAKARAGYLEVLAKGSVRDYPLTIRDATGQATEVLYNATVYHDEAGEIQGVFAAARDVTELRRGEAERARLAAAIEESDDGILITDADLRITYANPAFAADVGQEPSDLVERNALEVISVALDATTMARVAEIVGSAKPWLGEIDSRRVDGSDRRLQVRLTPQVGGNGEAGGLVVNIRDVTDLRRAEAERASSEARLQTAMDTMIDAVLVASAIRDGAGRIVDFRTEYTNPAIGPISRIGASDQIGHTLLEQFPAQRTSGLFEAYVGVVETGVPYRIDDFHYVDPEAAGGPLDQYVDQYAAKLGDGYVVSIRDVSERHRAEAETRRLATAIEQSADAVVITDADARIEYVNPAFEKVTGYTRGEAIGQNPRILKSGVQGPPFYEAMWATLTSGRSFVGDLTNRRKDGFLFQERAVISPVVDAGGKTTSYVAVKHDVTSERAVEAGQQRLARERSLVADALARLKPGPTPEATAAAICHHVVMLAGISSATLYRFSIEGPAVPLAFVRADGTAVSLRPLPARRSEYLHERAEGGPWVETWVHRPWHPFDRLFREMGVRAASYAPVRYGGDLVGLLTITTSGEDATSRLTESLPALLEFATGASALVGPAVAGLTQAGSVRHRIMKIIGEDRFHPVFQPIVDLGSRTAVGYEALTRFDSGQRPDLCFADAWAVELGPALELATLGAAVAAARRLPAGRWLSLNVSPRLVADAERLKPVVSPSERPIVLEITEHEIIEDYERVHAAIRALGHDVRLAVDDAGAGIANFSHIVELRPNLVKLDISLVRDVNRDLGRQALVVGMRHFAAEAGCLLLAEGVETEAEAGTLLRLRVDLGQGYLFGRPEPAEVWATAGKPRGRAHPPRSAT